MKNYVWVVVVTLIFFSSGFKISAQSHYVLPYPGTMPGNKVYSLLQLKDTLEEYWYFGDFAQFLYHRQQADKYLVEAKTLFEYKQYLLAHQALKKSDEHFVKLPGYLKNAKEQKKDITEKKRLLTDMALKHTEVLRGIYDNVPETFTWTPEKDDPTVLNLRADVTKALQIRSMY